MFKHLCSCSNIYNVILTSYNGISSNPRDKNIFKKFFTKKILVSTNYCKLIEITIRGLENWIEVALVVVYTQVVKEFNNSKF